MGIQNLGDEKLLGDLDISLKGKFNAIRALAATKMKKRLDSSNAAVEYYAIR